MKLSDVKFSSDMVDRGLQITATYDRHQMAIVMSDIDKEDNETFAKRFVAVANTILVQLQREITENAKS